MIGKPERILLPSALRIHDLPISSAAPKAIKFSVQKILKNVTWYELKISQFSKDAQLQAERLPGIKCNTRQQTSKQMPE